MVVGGAILTLVGLLAACGDAEPVREISAEELPLAVLPLEDVKAVFEGFGFSESPEARPNDRVIKEAFDPEDETQDIDRYGRLDGYRLYYSLTPEGNPNMDSFQVVITVQLFRDAAGASAYLADELTDLEQSVGLGGADRLQEMSRFKAKGGGDESVGLVTTRDLVSHGVSFATGHTTAVAIRRGQLLGLAEVLRLDGGERQDEAQALARRLDQRFKALLRGQLGPTSTQSPQ